MDPIFFVIPALAFVALKGLHAWFKSRKGRVLR